MKNVALMGIALAVQAPAKAATLKVNASPAPTIMSFSCVAPRAPLPPNAHEKYRYIANAIVTGIPDGENGSSIQRKDLRVTKFLKGRFAPLRVRAYFSYMCGPEGLPFKVGDQLTLYIKLHKDRDRGQAVSVDYWRPLSPNNG